MRADLPAATRSRAAIAHFSLIRPCGATFSLRAKSRLRRLRFDTRLRAQPQGGRRRKQNGTTAQNLLEYNWENPRREKQYILPMFVPGSAEFFNMNKRQIADRPEVTTFFERMTFLPLEHIIAMVPPGGAGIGMHVIPVEKAIETENRSADIEHISHWLKKPDIFVGGDVCTGPRFAIDAIAAGKQGAISIHRFVQPNTSLTIGRNRRDFHELDKSNLALGEYDRAPRQSAALDAGIDAHRSFRDAHLTLTEDQVKIETARCLGCGASVVDPNKCIGCGVCTTKCEFDAIRLHRDLPECSKMVRS